MLTAVRECAIDAAMVPVQLLAAAAETIAAVAGRLRQLRDTDEQVLEERDRFYSELRWTIRRHGPTPRANAILQAIYRHTRTGAWFCPSIRINLSTLDRSRP